MTTFTQTFSLTASSTGNRVPAPLTGSVPNGSWVAKDITVAGVTLPSGKQVHFCYMLPAQYSSSFIYPILAWEHPTFDNSWYSGGEGPTDSCYKYGDPYYNNTPFRTNYPCIAVVLYADQTPGNDAINNFGGWVNDGSTGSGTHASGDTGPNVFATIGVMQWILANLSADPTRVYINGFSLGGIGSEYMLLKYNRVNGNPKIFTSGTSTGGTLAINNYGGPSSADTAAMTNVPVWWVSGGNDTTSNPSMWNDPMWRALAGNSNYPLPGTSATAAKAGTSLYRYWRDPNIGHQPDNASGAPYATNTTILDFMFSQII